MASGKLPVDFEKKVKQAAAPNGLGSPIQISARDLMANYKYLLDLISNIPDAPESGTYVLGSVGGTLTWLATEECESP